MDKKPILICSIILIMFVAFILYIFPEPSLSINSINTNRAVKNDQTKAELKVLVVQIDPFIKAITNDVLYPETGHPRVSDYLNGASSSKKALDELIEDIEYSSGNFIKVDYTLEELDEYVHYTKDILLSDGTKGKALNEQTLLKYSGGETQDTGSQSALLKAMENDMVTNSIDYEYYIEKLDLVKKRENEEFDQVWLLTYEPSGSAEIAIVGNKDLGANGAYIKKDCLDFILATVSPKNRNSNFHHLLHGLEAVLNKVFKIENNEINKAKNYEVYTDTRLNQLNLWQRFTLSGYNNNKDYTGMGTLHYPPNAEAEYDYENKTEVKSEYENWTNYPNFVNDKRTRLSQETWNCDEEIDKITNKGNLSPERLYTRWWASHLPKSPGANEKGYYNNWWKYFLDLDYVTSIMVESTTDLEFNVKDKLIIKYILGYNSGTFVKENEVKFDNNIIVSDPSVLDYENGWVVAKAVGETILTIRVDNQEVSYNIIVKEGTAKKTEPVNNEDDDVLVIGGKPKQTTTKKADKEEEPEVSPETDEENSERMKTYIIFGVVLFVGLVVSIFTYRTMSMVLHHREMYNFSNVIIIFFTILLLTGCGKKDQKTEYYCENGYTLVGEVCSKRTEVPANTELSCPDGYEYSTKVHKCYKEMEEDAYYRYYCGIEGYKLNNQNMCDGYTSKPGKAVYYCVAGELDEKKKVCEHFTINNKVRACNPKCERGKPNAYNRCEETFDPTPGVGCPTGNGYTTLGDGQCYYSADAVCEYTCTSPYVIRNNNCVYIDKTTKANQKYECAEGTLSGSYCLVPNTVAPQKYYYCDDGKKVPEGSTKCIYYDYKERIDREYCDDGLQLEGHMCVKIETKNAMSK